MGKIGKKVLVVAALVAGCIAIAVLGEGEDPSSDAYLRKLSARIVSAAPNEQAQGVIGMRAVLGQALACKVDQQRILKLATLTSATIKVLAGSAPEIEAVSNDIMSMGGHRQLRGLYGSCADAEKNLAKVEEFYRTQNLYP